MSSEAPSGWPAPAPERSVGRLRARILLGMVLVIATAGLVYELAMAAVASYVLGDSVTQFSLVIGVYLSALGLGAYLSRFLDRKLALRFVDVELATALLGGLSAPSLFIAFAHTGAFHLVLYATVVAVGVLVGLELPILMRILRTEYEFKDVIAKALTFDYAGALIGSVAFSLLLFPRLGLVQSSIVCGLLNALVGLVSTWVLADGDGKGMVGARVRAVIVCALLGLALFESGRMTRLSEQNLYGGRVLLAAQSRYQRIVLSGKGDGYQLFLNGNLQFSSIDEHRYHEALVHPVMAAAQRHESVLIGGGGDGLAVREVLRWPGVKSVTLVDLDPRMTGLALHDPRVTASNHESLHDPRVHVENADAMVWFSHDTRRYDVVILDFPDPSNYALGKLYTAEFYRSARDRLADDGALVVQSTSPLFARRAYWCVATTLASVGLAVRPYRVFVPTFGEWGYLLAKHHDFPIPTALPPATLRYLTPPILASLFRIPDDMSRIPAQENHLDNQALVAYYLADWERWN